MAPLTYTHNQDQNIHVFHIHEASRAAVDAYAAEISKILQHIGTDSSIRIILDFSDSTLFPLQYMQRKMKSVGEKYAPVPPSYVAYICDHPGDRSLIQTLDHSRSIRREDNRQTFSSKDIQAAIDWLLTK